MDLFTSMQTSSTALTAERTRMNLVSSNLANANTTRTPEGGPYKRKDAVFTATPDRKSVVYGNSVVLAGRPII